MSFRCEKEKMKMEAQRGDGKVRKQRLPEDSGLRPMSGLIDLSLEDSWEAPNMCDKITGAAKQRIHCGNMAMGVRRSRLGLSRISEKVIKGLNYNTWEWKPRVWRIGSNWELSRLMTACLIFIRVEWWRHLFEGRYFWISLSKEYKIRVGKRNT